jgi:7-keto-8-aminopelargonate synthetase-like enzyme
MSRFSFASLTALVLALSVAACAPAAPPDNTGADLAALDEEIRFQVNADHTESDIDRVLEVLAAFAA